MKRSFFLTAVGSVLQCGCTKWTLAKRMEKKLVSNYTRMLRAIFNKSWRQYPTKQQLYGHQPLITKTIQVRRTKHAEHCWRSRDWLMRDFLQWTPAHGRAKAGRLARTNSFVRIRDLALRTCQKRWTIGRSGEIGSGILLYFDLRPGQKCHSKVMHRKEVTYSDGSYERNSRGRKLADEMGRGKKNSHGTPEESDLWTAWQLFPLDDDQTRDFKNRVGDRVGVGLLYNSVKTEVKLVPVRVGDGDKRVVVGKDTSGRRGLGAPDELQLEIEQNYHIYPTPPLG